MREVDAGEAAVRRDEYADRSEERNRSAVIDAIRAIAALMVVFAHSAFVAGRNDLRDKPWLGHLALVSGAGVLLFFVVSGYLIGGPFIRALIEDTRRPRSAPYLVRRVARIYPAYWVALAAVLITLYPAGGVRAYQYPVHFLLLQSSWPVPGEPAAIFFVAWTLGIEMAFYLFVPLAAWVLWRMHRGPWQPGVLAALVAAAGVASAVCAIWSPIWFATPNRLELFARIGLHAWIFAFVPGLLLAIREVTPQTAAGVRAADALFRRWWLAFPLAAGLWALAYAADTAAPGAWRNAAAPLYSVASGVFIGAFLVIGPRLRVVVRPLAGIGLVSYGIYLWHDIIVNLLIKHGESGAHSTYAALVLDFALVLALTLPLATLSWFVFEKPFIQRAAAWARRHRPPAAASHVRPAPVASADTA